MQFVQCEFICNSIVSNECWPNLFIKMIYGRDVMASQDHINCKSTLTEFLVKHKMSCCSIRLLCFIMDCSLLMQEDSRVVLKIQTFRINWKMVMFI